MGKYLFFGPWAKNAQLYLNLTETNKQLSYLIGIGKIN